MYKKNFQSNLAAALDKSDPRDSFKYVYFKDGNAVATDAKILVESPLKLHEFTPLEAENLDGYCISIDQFKRVKAFHRIEVNAPGKITCYSKDESSVDEYLRVYSEIGHYPNYKAVIPTNRQAVESIGLDFSILARVKDLLIIDGKLKRAKLTFTGYMGGVLVSDGSGQMIMVMPCHVNF